VSEDRNASPPEAALLEESGHIESQDEADCEAGAGLSVGTEPRQTADASEGNVADEAVPHGSPPNEGSTGEIGDAEQEEEDVAPDFDDNDEELQEDEETREYRPLFIEKMLEAPPILPGESKTDFASVFESYEYDYKPPHRPKSDIEYHWVWQATVATWTLMRLERMAAAIVANAQRPAAELLHEKAYGLVPSSKEERRKHKQSAKEGAMDYFLDPDYRRKFDSQLERGGFSTNAVEGEAFLQALPSLTQIERLKKSAKKDRDDALKQLDLVYANRHPDQPMPQSLEVTRTVFFLQERRDKELELAEQESARAEKAHENGNPQTDRSE